MLRAPERSSAVALMFLTGMLLSGYGGLILLGLLAHESRLVGAFLVVAGVAIWLASLRHTRHEPVATDPVPVSRPRRLAVGLLGATALGGVLAYNAWTASTLSLPEMAILVYGLALLLATPHLGRRVARTDVGTLVAWSLPLLAAPLGMYAVDAYFDARVGAGDSPLDWFIVHALVAPMAKALALMGFEATSTDQVVALTTPRGRLFLSVGVVCAGLEPGVLFLGAFGLYAWRERTPPRRLAALLALGLGGVYVANLVRLVVLALVGYHKGGEALQVAHAHAGWIIFVGWMLLYWWLVLRRLQGAPVPPRPGA